MTTTGRCARRLSPSLGSPMRRVSSSCTTLMKAWPGVRLLVTSMPTARARTASVKVFTTGSATSASSSARRTSRTVSEILSSVSRPRPDRDFSAAARLDERRSNIVLYYSRTVLLAITLFALYAAGAWLMLRSAAKPKLEPFAWVVVLIAIIGHSDSIMRMMRTHGAFSIGLLEAMSLLGWFLSVLACLVSIDKQNRVLGAILLLSAAVGSAV